MSSGATFSPLPGSAAYTAAKSGLNNLSAVAHAELADANITVSPVYPFATATEFYGSVRAGGESASEMESSFASQIHTPEQVAEVILELIQTGAERADLTPERFGGTYKG